MKHRPAVASSGAAPVVRVPAEPGGRRPPRHLLDGPPPRPHVLDELCRIDLR